MTVEFYDIALLLEAKNDAPVNGYTLSLVYQFSGFKSTIFFKLSYIDSIISFGSFYIFD